MKISLLSPSGDEKKYRIDTQSNPGVMVLKLRHSSVVLDSTTMAGFAASGYHLVTDVPGKVVAALDGKSDGVVYQAPEEQRRLMHAVHLHGLTNADLAARTMSSPGQPEKWTGDPWSVRHQPIPASRLALLESSLEKDPPGPPSGMGRKRRKNHTQ